MPQMTFRLPGGRRVQVSDVPNDDDVLTFDVVSNTWDSEPAQGGVTGFSTKFKTSDETINNDNTLTDDVDIQFEAEANGVYAIKVYLFLKSGANADFAYTFAAPSGASAEWINSGSWHPTNARGTDNLLDKTTLQTNNNIQTTPVYVMLKMGPTPGTFAFQWAQNSNSGNNTTLLKGTWMSFKKLN